MEKPKRKRFNITGTLVGSSNVIRVSLCKRFKVIVRSSNKLFLDNYCSIYKFYDREESTK